MKHFTQTALSSIDSYKLGHADQFPEGTTKVYSNFTPRSLKHLQVPYQYGTTQVVWFGLQAFLNDLQSVWQETFFDRTKEEVVSEFMELVGPFCGPRGFNQSRIEWLHDLGYLPIEIKSLPEATLVPAGVPVLTITNTLPEAYWLPNFLETWLSADLWKPSTAATISYTYRKIIDHYTELTGGNKEFVMWQGHDFSSRGMSGIQDAARTGAGHLLSFAGTDNVTAVQLVNDAYHGKETFVGGSVPATEHSVMTSSILVEAERLRQTGVDEDNVMTQAELNVIKRLVTEVYPSGVVSVVSDSFDFWKVITEIAPTLKNEILDRVPDQLGLAKVVFRPDSGDPVKIICGHKYKVIDDIDDTYEMISASDEGYEVVYNKMDDKYYEFETYDDGWSTSVDFKELQWYEVKGAIECLWDTFGGTTNEKGFKTLNQRVGLIYGDSITLGRCDEILKLLAEKGFASDNIVFGIGSFTFQYNTRDTLGFAMKATYVEIDGKPYSIFKDPKTDSGTKKSAKGLLQVVQDGDTLKVNQDVTWEEEKQGLLRTVYLDGKITVSDTFADIRSRLGVI
jgi:nicotinamide phosphoribosyltransferase